MGLGEVIGELGAAGEPLPPALEATMAHGPAGISRMVPPAGGVSLVTMGASVMAGPVCCRWSWPCAGGGPAEGCPFCRARGVHSPAPKATGADLRLAATPGPAAAPCAPILRFWGPLCAPRRSRSQEQAQWAFPREPRGGTSAPGEGVVSLAWSETHQRFGQPGTTYASADLWLSLQATGHHFPKQAPGTPTPCKF